ncbi:MAG: EAL domain-containing protein, partial [Gammaproteobacteria bacterium]|nr:EAL domain-containing protein [Gammaproteobacteria bacterium]
QLYKQTIQPINNAQDFCRLHCEILLRMLDDDGAIISPVQFIPAAERYNLMSAVDKWVIDNTFKWLSEQDDLSETISMCCINLSGLSIGLRIS